MAVRISGKLPSSAAHIRERQPREGAEQVEVAVQFLFGVFQFPSINRRISSLVRKLRVVSSFLISYSRNGSRVSHSLLMAMNTIVRSGQTYSHTVLVQQCLSVRRNISKSEMNAGVSSFKAMSFTFPSHYIGKKLVTLRLLESAFNELLANRPNNGEITLRRSCNNNNNTETPL